MPHGSLTPLGNSLRSVLAALRPSAIHRDNANTLLRPLQCPVSYSTTRLTRQPNLRRIRPRHTIGTRTCQRAQHEAAAPAVETSEEILGETTHTTPKTIPAIDTTEATPPDTTSRAPIRFIGRRRENRRTKVDYLGKELRAIGKSEIAPQKPPEWKRENHFAHRSRHAKRLHAENKKRHTLDYIPPLESAHTPNLTRILATYLRHVANNSRELRAEWEADASFRLSPNDKRFLVRMNCGQADLEAWAAMVTEPDSFKAANLLHARVANHGTRSVPLPIASYILRRPYITANALRIFIEHVWALTADLSSSSPKTLSSDAVFLVFSRLARHARHVWPDALPSVADYLVRFLPDIRPNRKGDASSAAQTVTFMLNKAMYLISEPTAVSPFKNIHHQEAAVIRLLSAMAEHNPPLQIAREGYRAVIRLQLAMGKTENERQWAALKALSWPPWKEDRTRMDSEIGPEHGISRARATLNRMKEAGYAPQSWEEIAGVYTGWDVDGTPTIQTRVVLPVWNAGKRASNHEIAQRHNASLWAARIKTTRTAQEAWACYLAFEDTQLPADESVLLAILKKLHKEDLRLRKLDTTVQEDFREHNSPQRSVFPGDSQEVEPLPPSTHLYTYTRTSPPSAHEFCIQVQDHGIHLRDQCLAFLISNAASFKDGLEYVKTAEFQYPAVGGVHTLDARLPNVLFIAYVKFLCRYSNVRGLWGFKKHSLLSPSLDTSSSQLDHVSFNFQHNLIQAIWFLKERKPVFLPVWNAVLDALAREESYKTMHLTEKHDNATDARGPPDLNSNTIVAYRLTQQVLQLLRDQNMVLDTYGFLAICRSTENVGVACWAIFAQDYDANKAATDSPNTAQEKTASRSALEAQELLVVQRPQGRVEHYFKLLVGGKSFEEPEKTTDTSDLFASDDTPDSSPPLPSYLTIPEPALLHAYIRALGWHASYTSILTALKWMAKHQNELAETCEQAPNGPKLMRRTIVAARVFLERSWLPSNWSQDCDLAEHDDDDDGKPETLKRLEAQASDRQIEEARALVESVEGWGGWPTDGEVGVYCRDEKRFKEFR